MPGKAKPELRAAVKVLAMQGKTMRQTADEIGATRYAVAYHMRELMAAGEIPKGWERRGPPAHPYNRLTKDYGVKFGRMSALITTLPREHVRWLVKQIPKGGNFVDVLRSIIVDAYEEERD
jgi:predicted ArsR family transcriptional regulator